MHAFSKRTWWTFLTLVAFGGLLPHATGFAAQTPGSSSAGSKTAADNSNSTGRSGQAKAAPDERSAGMADAGRQSPDGTIYSGTDVAREARGGREYEIGSTSSAGNEYGNRGGSGWGWLGLAGLLGLFGLTGRGRSASYGSA